MSNQLSKAPILQAVVCTLGLEDGDAGLTRLAEELTIGLNPWSADNPEFALCRQDYLFAFRQTVGAGGAGFRSIAQLHNDSPDAIVVVEPGCLWLVGGGTVLLSRSNVLATTDGGLVAQARDSRYLRPAVPYVRARSQNGAALPAGISNGIFFGSGGTQYSLVFPYVLRPGDTLSAFPDADNVAMTSATWVGRVRRILNQRELLP
jgi:hypothetical protein